MAAFENSADDLVAVQRPAFFAEYLRYDIGDRAFL